MTENLKTEYDQVEKLTAQINKREALLGVEQTEFKELRVIQDDLKPLFELWIIASKFSKTFPSKNLNIISFVQYGWKADSTNLIVSRLKTT